jgi:hypothetical protein
VISPQRLHFLVPNPLQLGGGDATMPGSTPSICWGVYSLEGDVMTTKETVLALLDRLPDDCSLEDVQYHLYVIQALEEGEADEAHGRVIPHEQVAAELRRKWLLGHAK